MMSLAARGHEAAVAGGGEGRWEMVARRARIAVAVRHEAEAAGVGKAGEYDRWLKDLGPGGGVATTIAVSAGPRGGGSERRVHQREEEAEGCSDCDGRGGRVPGRKSPG
jgi:hypothetical protein